MVVGGCAFLVDASIYLIFADIFDLHPFWARLIAFFIAVGVTCIGNRKFTFANSHLSPILTQYTKAILAAVVSLIPNMLVF
jgi:putative flippase GtrA